MSSRGSYLLRGVSVASCTMLIWPAMFFMWIDYRALDVGINKAMTTFTLSPTVSIILAFMEIGILIATGLTLVQQVRRYQSQNNFAVSFFFKNQTRRQCQEDLLVFLYCSSDYCRPLPCFRSLLRL